MPHGLSKWQRGVVYGMYTTQRTMGQGGRLAFTRRALEHMLWFDWQGYHTKAIDQLVEWRWLDEVFTADHLIAYKLTHQAEEELSGNVAAVVGGCRLIEPVSGGDAVQTEIPF